jgi:hypothetical protein
MGIKNAKDLIEWIQSNTEHTSEANAVPAALWFVAYHEAVEDHGSNTVKDWAHVILNGLPGVTPEYVDDWFEQMIDLYDGDMEEFNCEGLLKAHFDIDDEEDEEDD